MTAAPALAPVPVVLLRPVTAQRLPAARRLGAGRRAARRLRPYARLLLLIGPALALSWLATHIPTLRLGMHTLAVAAPGWLAAAVVVMSLTWVAVATCQQGAVVQHLPGRRLLAVCFAGSAANHALPGGLGSAALTLSFLRRQGLCTRTAAHAVTLKAAAALVVQCGALLVLVATGVIPMRSLLFLGIVVGAVALAVAVVLAVLTPRPALRARLLEPVFRSVRDARAQWRAVGTDHRRRYQLWGGSMANLALHALVVACIARAIGSPATTVGVVGAYLVAGCVASLIPTPGGFGSLEAALAIELHGAGMSSAQALATVVAYRLLSMWGPLVPSAATLGVLRRRRVV